MQKVVSHCGIEAHLFAVAVEYLYVNYFGSLTRLVKMRQQCYWTECELDLLTGQLTMMRKIRFCAMHVATANMPSLTSRSLPGRAAQSTLLRMRTIVKRFVFTRTLAILRFSNVLLVTLL